MFGIEASGFGIKTLGFDRVKLLNLLKKGRFPSSLFLLRG